MRHQNAVHGISTVDTVQRIDSFMNHLAFFSLTYSQFTKDIRIINKQNVNKFSFVCSMSYSQMVRMSAV